MAQSFDYITSARLEHLNKYSAADRLKLLKLERKFQKLCYVPIDIPKVVPADMESFLSWYSSYSKPVRKIAADVACGIREQYDFKAIDSHNQINFFWQQNRRNDIFSVLPELKDALSALPIINPEFSLWSSIGEIKPHRDAAVWEDLPVSFRIMLYDNNPTSTLSLQHAPAVRSSYAPWRSEQHAKFILPRLESTNTFVWNNLRTVHSSSYQPEYQKILLIFTNVKIDFDKYEELIARSVQKYEEFIMISDHSRATFCAV
jgi:hypothetical protein